MSKHFILVFVLIAGLSTIVFGQDDPVLFTVEGSPVHVSEFDYIYSKSKIDTASYTRASLNEYLELYKNFKLKVRRAKEMKLDTIPVLQKELAGYRKQLANSYLVDREVTDKLIQEAYDRSLFDVNISHIMVSLPPDAAGNEVKAAEQRLEAIQKSLKEGVSFEELAKKSSDDKNTSINGGLMGHLTAVFPDGFYNLESAAYNTPVGEVSDIFRTVAGLHLVKVNSKRDAIGQMETAHILIRQPKGGDQNVAKTKIDSIYKQLKEGADFAQLAKELSEDAKTAANGGYIGFIGLRHPFEDIAFMIQEDGGFSEPMQTAIGWHILKRISKKPMDTFEISKRRIQTKMQDNQRTSKNPTFNRLNNARNSMIERIKREGKFSENRSVLDSFIVSLDSTFISYKWKAPKIDIPKDRLFSLGEGETFVVTSGEFQDFCQRNSKRMRMGKKMSTEKIVVLMYDEYIDESCIRFEEMQLEEKYPEFKSLMREYEEGILLFEATKILVWDKASQDTVGLAAFFENNKEAYKWDERAVVSTYGVTKGKEAMIPGIIKKAKKYNGEKLLAKVNKKEKVLSQAEKIYEQGKSPLPEGLEWKAGSVSEVTVNKKNMTSSFFKLEKILPQTNKELKDARGFVIADYQNNLEKEWIKELKASYSVKVDEKVFDNLIKR
ncbi:MAG: peptidyl-prolyl cis-trans isomerase SurA [Saprospiraceae bacterium]|jgi:peptidyl-prolyl cis-trans isomerase SurA